MKKDTSFQAPDGSVPVVVTTAHRGVFFGYAQQEALDKHPKSIDLLQARNCIYWAADLRGFMGLATVGPNKACKIGPTVDRLTLQDITCVVYATADAASNWRSPNW